MLCSVEEIHELADIPKLRLHICLPKQGVQVVIVTANSRVSILDKVFPSQNKVYLYNGTVLMKNSLLSIYSITDGESILAVDHHDYSIKPGYWAKMTQNKENFTLRVKRVIDPSIAIEMSRLSDLRATKIINRKNGLRKLTIKKNDSPHISVPTIIPEAATCASSDPLPIMW